MLDAKLTASSLEDQGVVVLREAIIAGHLPSGKLHRIRDVSRRLAVSPTPVILAVKRLEAEGYVTLLPRRGFLVRDLSYDDLEELTVMRAAIEGYAAGLGVQCITPVGMAHMAQLVAQINELLAEDVRTAAKNSDAIARLDAEFHLTLIRATGRERLIETIEKLRDRSRAYMNLAHTLIMPHMHDSQAVHEELLTAAQEQDTWKACRLTSWHILGMCKELEPMLRTAATESQGERQCSPPSRTFTPDLSDLLQNREGQV